MDLSRFETATLTFTKPSPQTLQVRLTARVPKTADVAEAWKVAREEVLASPCVAGLELAKQDGEDVSLALQKRSITAALNFTAPANKA